MEDLSPVQEQHDIDADARTEENEEKAEEGDFKAEAIDNIEHSDQKTEESEEQSDEKEEADMEAENTDKTGETNKDAQKTYEKNRVKRVEGTDERLDENDETPEENDEAIDTHKETYEDRDKEKMMEEGEKDKAQEDELLRCREKTRLMMRELLGDDPTPIRLQKGKEKHKRLYGDDETADVFNKDQGGGEENDDASQNMKDIDRNKLFEGGGELPTVRALCFSRVVYICCR